MHLDPGAPTDLEHLGHAAAAEGALGVRAARLGHVDAAKVTHEPADLDELVGARPGPRVVARARGETDRPLLHTLSHQGLIALHRIGVAGERHVPESDRLETYRAVGHKVGGVDGHLPVVVRAEGLDAAHIELLGRLTEEPLQPAPIREVVVVGERRVRHAVDAQQLGGDALAQPARVLRVDEEITFRVRVRVDEPRRDDQPAGVDDPLGGRLGEIAKGSDRLAGDGNVGAVPGRPGPVHDCTAGDEHVEHSGLLE
jgi:hypothetical protein